MTIGKYYDMENDPVVDALIRPPSAGDVPWSDRAGTAGSTNTAGPDMTILASDMSLRDHFAGLALQGMMANNPLFASPEVAYQKADEMMRVRLQ